VSHQAQTVIGSEFDEFADFVRGLEDGPEVAERMDRWFEPADRVASV
jgi:hypothetical protein